MRRTEQVVLRALVWIQHDGELTKVRKRARRPPRSQPTGPCAEAYRHMAELDADA
jgi:hypothetical protein